MSNAILKDQFTQTFSAEKSNDTSSAHRGTIVFESALRTELEQRVKDINQKLNYETSTFGPHKEISTPANSINLPKFNNWSSVLNSSQYSSGTQQWLGHVTKIDKDSFQANLQDLTQGGTFEVGSFELKEVSNEDKTLLKLGAAFYWSVGYINNNGQIETKSFIRFQRVDYWTESDYDQALERAEKLGNTLKWED